MVGVIEAKILISNSKEQRLRKNTVAKYSKQEFGRGASSSSKIYLSLRRPRAFYF